MKVVTMASDAVIDFAAGRIFTLPMPILFPTAAGGLAGGRAISCVTSDGHAFFRGWLPFFP